MTDESTAEMPRDESDRIPIRDGWVLYCSECEFGYTGIDYVRACPGCGSAKTRGEKRADAEAKSDVK